MQKKVSTLVGLIIIITFSVVSFGGVFAYQYFFIKTQPTTQNPQQLIGGDKDAHGCLPSAGYTWCEVKQKCLHPWEEKCEATTSSANPAEVILKLTSPIGGEQWQVGKTYDITWDAQNIGGIDYISVNTYEILQGVNFAKNNASHANSKTVIKDIDPSVSHYSWTIPSDFNLSSNNKIYISGHCINNGNCGGEEVDSSDNYFSIVASTDSTADWKTYTNSKYGFSFQYPPSLGDLTIAKDNSLVIGQIGNDKGVIFMPGYFHDITNKTSTYSDIINEHSGAGYTKTNVVVGGIQSVGIFSSQTGYTIYVPFANNQFLTILGVQNDPVFNQILSTFKFTK